ncbi:sugar phosphate isomerase/epimerase family protein [Bacillus sp. UNC438CL73TsuS30]|uniref:sugar phosphate isomerase/epimerase family protein n=1 Tax=Bacillus sp. UNC438CL73TsuS30 TaxID=1340434 RepID=UPI00047E11A1|nr:TIM barrel protein [Bacillus sp. UNC438CL73TsuS30]
MKIAGMNITFRHYPFRYFLDCMDRLNISSIELWAGEPHLYVYRNLLSNLREIKREVKARDMEIVCYTPEQCIYPFNLATSDSQWRKASIDYFIENLHAAVELETDKMLITSGMGDFSLTQEESWKYTSDSIFQISKAAEQEGITLALEPLTKFESNLIIDTPGLKRMIEEIQSPSLKGMIDTVAMQLAGETPDDYFSMLPELSHFHLIDGDSETDSHLALDDGNLNWREYVKSLQNHQYEGACTLEIMGSSYYQNPQDAVKKSLEKLNELGIL